MALYHFHVTQISRGKGQSVCAAAAYRSGEKIHDSYYGEDPDYTKKGIYSFDILKGNDVISVGQHFEIKKKGMSEVDLFG